MYLGVYFISTIMEPLRGSIIFCHIGLIQHPRRGSNIVADSQSAINILVEDSLLLRIYFGQEISMKPAAYTQFYHHLIFAVKYRQRLLKEDIRPEIFSYISGIITKRGHKSIIVNGVSDHIHILIGLNPNDKISDLVASIKRSSSTYINQQRWFKQKFQWQDGYGGFSYNRSQIKNVYRYIQNQEIHHRRNSFKNEYVHMLKRYKIEFNEKYLFDFF